MLVYDMSCFIVVNIQDHKYKKEYCARIMDSVSLLFYLYIPKLNPLCTAILGRYLYLYIH